jgi:hypothetical protein
MRQTTGTMADTPAVMAAMRPLPNIYYSGAPTYGGVTQEDRQVLAETNAASEESCNGLAPGVTDFPVERIKQVVQPTGDQLTALNDLGAGAVRANEIIKASYPTAVPLTPVARSTLPRPGWKR